MTDPAAQDDPMEGQEINILNALLSKAYPLARNGDGAMMERVLKILELKRRRRERADAGKWRL